MILLEKEKKVIIEFLQFRKIMKESDIITFHVPLNKSGIDQTYHLADEKFFNQLEKSQ